MHNYKYVNDICELSQSEKEAIWNNPVGVSGSAVPNIMSDMAFAYKLKKGLISWPETKFSEQKKRAGNHYEDSIINFFNNNTDLFPIFEGANSIWKDKKTFVSTDNPNFTLNIDGYIPLNSSNPHALNNIKTILEVKNSEKSIQELYVAYEWQIRYEMWFTNAQDAYLLALINGFNHEWLHIERDLDKEKLMLDTITKYLGFLESNEEPASSYNPTEVFAYDKEALGDWLPKVDRYIELNESIKVLEKEQELIKTEIKNGIVAYVMEQNKNFDKIALEGNNGFLNYSITKGKKSVDYTNYAKDLDTWVKANVQIECPITTKFYEKKSADSGRLLVSRKKGE